MILKEVSRYTIIGPYLKDTVHYIGPEAAYRIAHKHASSYAISLGRKLAEGPTEYIKNSPGEPVEFWPLVQEV